VAEGTAAGSGSERESVRVPNADGVTRFCARFFFLSSSGSGVSVASAAGHVSISFGFGPDQREEGIPRHVRGLSFVEEKVKSVGNQNKISAAEQSFRSLVSVFKQKVSNPSLTYY
jgi:hypothetical protein